MAKKEITVLAERLRVAAEQHDPIARAAIELVKLCADEAKESLVGADGDDMLRLQGEARRLQKLHRELTVTPPKLPGANE